jgi:hypothetical protein
VDVDGLARNGVVPNFECPQSRLENLSIGRIVCERLGDRASDVLVRVLEIWEKRL